MAPSSLPRSLHASTPDSLGGPRARPRARDRSVRGEDRGGGVGAEELALGRGGTRASEQQLGGGRPGSSRAGVRPGRTEGDPGGRWGLSKCNTDKTHGWETSSPKVIFTRKLCCVDLLLCAEEFNYHVLRGVIISAADSARHTPDPAVVPLAETTPSPGDQGAPSPAGLSPPACPGLPQDLSDPAQRRHLAPPLCPGCLCLHTPGGRRLTPSPETNSSSACRAPGRITFSCSPAECSQASPPASLL